METASRMGTWPKSKSKRPTCRMWTNLGRPNDSLQEQINSYLWLEFDPRLGLSKQTQLEEAGRPRTWPNPRGNIVRG